MIPKKEYNKIRLKVFCLGVFLGFSSFIFLPLIPVIKENIQNQFISFLIILGYTFFLFANIFHIMYNFLDASSDKACAKWINKNKNKIKMKDVIFNHTVVDNDILSEIKSIYGKNALSFLFKNYGIESVTYKNILEFIENPKHYDINSSMDKKIENFVEII